MVAGNEDGVKLLKTTLETTVVRSVGADLRRSFHSWFHTARDTNESLIDYVSRFERHYFLFRKFGESLTSVCQALILIENINIDENTQALVSNNIDFKNAKSE